MSICRQLSKTRCSGSKEDSTKLLNSAGLEWSALADDFRTFLAANLEVVLSRTNCLRSINPGRASHNRVQSCSRLLTLQVLRCRFEHACLNRYFRHSGAATKLECK
jgi:hypothetical protein